MLCLEGLSWGTLSAADGSGCTNELSGAGLAFGHQLGLQLTANIPQEVLKRQLLQIPRGPYRKEGRP